MRFLKLILGNSGTGKTINMRNIARDIILKNKKVLFLVPEQNSFETEKAFLDLLGEKNLENIKILSFSRLCTWTLEKQFLTSRPTLDEMSRRILMFKSLEELAPNLKIYKSEKNKKDLIDLLIDTFAEFKMCDINLEKKYELFENINSNILKLKIEELRSIYTKFENLLEQSFLDPLENLNNLEIFLEKTEFFKDFYIFFDGFTGFTLQQEKIFKKALSQAQGVFLSLCTPVENLKYAQKFSIFKIMNQTAKMAINFCNKEKIEIKKPVMLKEALRFNSSDLKNLNNNFLKEKKELIESSVDSEDIKVFKAKNIFEEIEIVAKNICSLIFKENFRFNQITVVTRNQELYAPIIERVFKKYNIKYFLDKREDIENKSFFVAILSILDIINNNFSSENIFLLLKTKLAGFSCEEIALLENYCFIWNIEKENWKMEFTAHPRGLGLEFTEKDYEILKTLNNIREKLIFPFLNFGLKEKKEKIETIAQKFFKLLKALNIMENLKSYAINLKNAGEELLFKEQLRLWDLFVDILDKMVNTLHGNKLNFAKFVQIFKLIINSCDFGEIPHNLDEVRIADIDRMRTEKIKIAFIIGARQGEFPKTPTESGLFTQIERKELINAGLKLTNSLEDLHLNEQFLAYKAISCASHKLYISWPQTDLKDSNSNFSIIISEILTIFTNIKIRSNSYFKPEENFWNEKCAFEYLIKNINQESELIEGLKTYFKKSKYKEKLQNIENFLQEKNYFVSNFSQDTNRNFNFSASQIEKFYQCRFSYFCKYILKAEKISKAKFSVLEYGKLMHFLLEKFISFPAFKEITALSRKNLFNKIRQTLLDYIKDFYGVLIEENTRLENLLNRLCHSALEIILHIINELEQSKFKPTDFELEISGKNKDLGAFILKDDQNLTIKIEGKIDRVDVFEKDNMKFLRIIDYKTGKKDFKLHELFYGLNLQMFIYLAAILQNGKKKYGQIKPAGILYLNTKKEVSNLEKSNKLCMQGLILKNIEIISAMEKETLGKFIPASINKEKIIGEKNTLTEKEFNKILSFTKKMIIDMAKNIKEGKINPVPLKLGQKTSCDFCEYNEICHIAPNEILNSIENFNKEEFFKRI